MVAERQRPFSDGPKTGRAAILCATFGPFHRPPSCGGGCRRSRKASRSSADRSDQRRGNRGAWRPSKVSTTIIPPPQHGQRRAGAKFFRSTVGLARRLGSILCRGEQVSGVLDVLSSNRAGEGRREPAAAPPRGPRAIAAPRPPGASGSGGCGRNCRRSARARSPRRARRGRRARRQDRSRSPT